MTVPSIITGTSITVMVKGKTLVAKSGHPNFETIKSTIKALVDGDDLSYLVGLFDIPKAIETKSQGAVVVQDGVVLYQGKPLHNTLTTRMLEMLNEGFDINPLVNFLTRLMKNPSFRAVNGLFDFLAATNIPITPEGKFLAFKKVSADYLDIYTGTIRNAVGDSPRVERHEVDEDPDRTCSHGLHVCSESYLPHFGSAPGNRVVIVEVDPADVVAIPKDYNNAKMRCAGYTVIGEVAYEEVKTAFTSSVMSADDFFSDEAWERFDEFDEDNYLDDEPTAFTKDVDGVIVTFTVDADGDWEADWTNPDGDETGVFLTGAGNQEEAIEEFRDNYIESACFYTADLRWLDEDGELNNFSVSLSGLSDEAPEAWEFIDEAAERGWEFPEHVMVVNIDKVPGTTINRGGYAY